MEQIYRYSSDYIKEWMKVTEKKIVTVIEAKKFPKHGHLVDTEMGGGGYHGRCCNCGLALVTDLGYNSWSGTQCSVERQEIVDIQTEISWSKDRKKASKLNEDKAREHFYNLLHQQGWGKYNFQTVDVDAEVW